MSTSFFHWCLYLYWTETTLIFVICHALVWKKVYFQLIQISIHWKKAFVYFIPALIGEIQTHKVLSSVTILLSCTLKSIFLLLLSLNPSSFASKLIFSALLIAFLQIHFLVLSFLQVMTKSLPFPNWKNEFYQLKIDSTILIEMFFPKSF